MRLLLITPWFPPETGFGPHSFHELGGALAARGHQVFVATGMPRYHVVEESQRARYQGRLWMRESLDGMTVLRIGFPWLPRSSMLARGAWQLLAAAALLPAALRL